MTNIWGKDIPQEVKNFMEEIELVCEKHGYSLSHEDGHGCFIVEQYQDCGLQLGYFYNDYDYKQDKLNKILGY